MNLNKLLSSFTFRYSLLYIALLSVLVTVVLAVVYAVYSYQTTNEILGAIDREFQALRGSYERAGRDGVDDFLQQRSQEGKFSQFYYLLADSQRDHLVGNLSEWPRLTRYPRGWLSFDVDVLQKDGNDSDAGRNYVGRSAVLPGGERLLVARDYQDVRSYYELIAGLLLRGMLVMVCLGTVGGALVSLSLLRRVELINRSIETIMTGDLSERIPLMRRGGDFDLLVKNLNLMLDRIESLMTGLRQVSDNIAHDLRTPLTRLRNNLAQLQTELGPAGEEKVEGMIEEADNLLATFFALLRIARIESGSGRSHWKDVHLNVLLQDVVELYEPLCAEKGQQIHLSLLGEVRLSADGDLLFQMFSNLVDNAIKYTPAGGVIRLGAARDGRTVSAHVSDSGPGIPVAERAKVLQRFYRGEASRSQLPGNGLGLSLVAAVVKLHNGEIRLEDNRPGLRVFIRIPVV